MTTELLRIDGLPAFCDLTRVGPLHLASVYSSEGRGEIISQDVQCGMDLDQDTAILKALVECGERLAIIESVATAPSEFWRTGSDGVAAYPAFLANAHATARTNAYNEATERFVWASWWDQFEYGHRVEDGASLSLSPAAREVLDAIDAIVDVKEHYRIRPWFTSDDTEVTIFFCVLRSGGVISGGACAAANSDVGSLRALGEMARHAEAARRIRRGVPVQTFYERRLQFMITPEAETAFRARLDHNGSRKIQLPELIIDRPIDHGLSEKLIVHRCLFSDQPLFVGGDIERLCL